jgi:hypothetical protein
MPAICLLNLQFGLAIFTKEVCRGVLRANDPCFSEMYKYSWPPGSFLCNHESDKLLLMSTKICHLIVKKVTQMQSNLSCFWILMDS